MLLSLLFLFLVVVVVVVVMVVVVVIVWLVLEVPMLSSGLFLLTHSAPMSSYADIVIRLLACRPPHMHVVS